MIPATKLSKQFWRHFTGTYWNRKPTVLRAPFAEPIATPAEVFRAAVAASRRRREPTDDFALFVGGRRIVMQRDLDRWLPRTADRSLERYVARLNRAPGNEVGIYVNNFQGDLPWPFFERLQEFLGGLYEITGVPANLAEVDLFLGNYRRTPAGVHRDSADVFCFVIEGRKRIRAWPATAIRSRSPRSGPVPYDRYLRQSICLDGEPGDVLFWPSSYWHVAESDGRPGSSLSLGLYYGSPLIHGMVHSLTALAQEDDGARRSVASLPFAGPRVAARIASAARRTGLPPLRLQRLLLRHWMERITGYGFAKFPPALQRVSLRTTGTVRANPTSAILFTKIDHSLVVAANGRSMTVPQDAAIESALRRLSSGRPCEADIFEGRTTRAVRRTLLFLLQQRAVACV